MKSRFLSLLLIALSVVVMLRCAAGPSQKQLEMERKAKQEAEAKRKAEQELQVKIALSNAMEYYKNKQYKDAIRNFRTVIDSLDPDNEIAYKYIADSYFRAGYEDSAEIAYKQAIEKFPEKAFLHRGLGFIYSRRDKDSLAYIQFLKAAELDTADYVSFQRLSSLCAQRGSIDSAIYWSEKAICYDSTNESTVRNLVRLYAKKGNREELIKTYELLHQLAPEDNQVLLDWGRTAAEAGSLKQAEKVIKEYLSRNPESSQARHLLGLTYYYGKQYQKALEQLKRARELNPENPKIDCDMGLIYKELKNYDMAFQYAQNALEKEKGYGYAYLLKGSVYEDQGFAKVKPDGTLTYEAKLEFEKAVNEYKKALHDPDWSQQAENKIKYLAEYLPTKEEKTIKKFLEEGREE